MTKQEQSRRFKSRQTDPLKQWKISPIDLQAQDKWDDYTEARYAMFHYTHTVTAPWTVIDSNNKRMARINCMRYVLSQLEYERKDEEIVGECDPIIVSSPTLALYTGNG